MDASEVTEVINELEEEAHSKKHPAKPGAAGASQANTKGEDEDEDEGGPEGINRQWVAIFISALAVLLAITSTGGGNATKDMMTANIIAADTYAFYQAKSIRQTSYKLAADEMLALRSTSLWLPTEAAAFIDQRLNSYQSTIAKYESEPSTGEGKKELLEKARKFEEIRDHAAKQDPYFDYAEALLQITIVLASVSIVVRRRWLLWLSYLFALIGGFLTLDAFFLLVDLPI